MIRWSMVENGMFLSLAILGIYMTYLGSSHRVKSWGFLAQAVAWFIETVWNVHHGQFQLAWIDALFVVAGLWMWWNERKKDNDRHNRRKRRIQKVKNKLRKFKEVRIRINSPLPQGA